MMRTIMHLKAASPLIVNVIFYHRIVLSPDYILTKGPSIQAVGKFSQIFDPYPPTVGSFLVLSIGKFGQFFTPPPLKHANVLNGWSLSTFFLQK